MAVEVKEYIPPTAFEKPRWDMTTDKSNVTYTVKKSFDGFVFFEIVVDKGQLHPKLQGRYTSAEAAIQDFIKHERGMAVTQTKQRDIKSEARKKAKDGAVHTEAKELLREGSAD